MLSCLSQFGHVDCNAASFLDASRSGGCSGAVVSGSAVLVDPDSHLIDDRLQAFDLGCHPLDQVVGVLDGFAPYLDGRVIGPGGCACSAGGRSAGTRPPPTTPPHRCRRRVSHGGLLVRPGTTTTTPNQSPRQGPGTR